MRTVEVLFVIIILLTSFAITSQFAVLPSPRDAFGTNLNGLSQSTLDTLDAKGLLSKTVFSDKNDPVWGDLQKALSASLPPNVVYNLTVYDIVEFGGIVTYELAKSISDSSFGTNSDSASLLVASPDVTYTKDIEKIGNSTGQEITLYILNCEDAIGWWITGYTGQSLATECYSLLSPYFATTILVNSTYELGLILNGNSLTSDVGENVENAVIINTFGETVPIPSVYCEDGLKETEGFDPNHDGGTYAKYFHTLGSLIRQYNWTWVSIVGYPFYYVTNTLNTHIASSQNGYGIYGMDDVKTAGINAFLQGLDGRTYTYDATSTATDVDVVQFTSQAIDLSNYYGIFPSSSQTASRALPQSIEPEYHLSLCASVFELKNNYVAGATFMHNDGNGALTAIGLTRIPDVRVAALALLMYYQPNVYRSNFGDRDTSRLVTLQLGQQGGA
jgi:hypothetical protein